MSEEGIRLRTANRMLRQDEKGRSLLPKQQGSERGVSLVLVASSMVVFLAMAGLAIDLASLYVGRSEAQRAADAGALAGAQEIVDSGYPGGLVTAGVAQSMAANYAAVVGNKNLVGGRNPNIQPTAFSASCPPSPGSSGCFDFSNPNNPRITVVVQQTMPTFFMKIFGVLSAPVSATATAEEYSGGGPPIGVTCLKPWLLPNCDPAHVIPTSTCNPTVDPSCVLANPNCPVTDPITGAITGYEAFFAVGGSLAYPGATSTTTCGAQNPGGVIGECIVIKPGSPSSAPSPGKFYPVFLPPGSQGTICPSCANPVSTGGTGSGALYRTNIECCNTNTEICGTATVQPINGDMTGPTAQGVDCLINENGGTGMDTLNITPYEVLAGVNDPLVTHGTLAAGSVISPMTSSSSVVTVPFYNGVTLCPGSSCPSTVSVTVEGYIQMFVKDETNPQGTVEAYVMNISICGTGGGSGTGTGGTGGGGAVYGGGASPMPVRLIHNN